MRHACLHREDYLRGEMFGLNCWTSISLSDYVGVVTMGEGCLCYSIVCKYLGLPAKNKLWKWGGGVLAGMGSELRGFC